jgi:hypothetical protein
MTPSRRLATYANEFEAMPVEMKRMDVVTGIAEFEPVALAEGAPNLRRRSNASNRERAGNAPSRIGSTARVSLSVSRSDTAHQMDQWMIYDPQRQIIRAPLTLGVSVEHACTSFAQALGYADGAQPFMLGCASSAV